MKLLHFVAYFVIPAAGLFSAGSTWAQPTTPDKVLAAYQARAGAPASAERGRALFMQKFKGTFESCTDCHTANPLRAGRDQVSEKAIPALAPAANSKRLTDTSRVEQSFRLNCKDVMGRECTAGEKADVVAWLISVKP